MGLRFQRRIRVLPGVRINLSTSGVSTSVGRRGAWLTIGRRGTRATVSLPGTGLSYTTGTRPSAAPGAAAAGPSAGNAPRGAFWWLLLLVGIGWLAWRALR